MTGMTQPFFTVVIPTSNRATLLQQAVQSVLNQSFTDFEIIIVDDHSTDNTSDVVNSFNDSRIIYVLNDHHKGGGGTRNAGIFRASGQWIAFLDDDDIWLPEKLEHLYRHISVAASEFGLVYSGHAVYDFVANEAMEIIRPTKAGWIMRDLLYRNYITGFSMVAIKAGILQSVGGLDERFPAMQDRELYVRIAQVAQVSYIDLPLVLVRTSNSDRITTNFAKRMHAIYLFREKYWEHIQPIPKLRHAIDSSIFVFATHVQDWASIWQMLPWTLAGILVDPVNLMHVCRQLSYGVRRPLRLSDGQIFGIHWRKPIQFVRSSFQQSKLTTHESENIRSNGSSS